MGLSSTWRTTSWSWKPVSRQFPLHRYRNRRLLSGRYRGSFTAPKRRITTRTISPEWTQPPTHNPTPEAHNFPQTNTNTPTNSTWSATTTHNRNTQHPRESTTIWTWLPPSPTRWRWFRMSRRARSTVRGMLNGMGVGSCRPGGKIT